MVTVVIRPLLVTSQATSNSSRSSTGSSSSSHAGSTPLRDVIDKERVRGILLLNAHRRVWREILQTDLQVEVLGSVETGLQDKIEKAGASTPPTKADLQPAGGEVYPPHTHTYTLGWKVWWSHVWWTDCEMEMNESWYKDRGKHSWLSES